MPDGPTTATTEPPAILALTRFRTGSPPDRTVTADSSRLPGPGGSGSVPGTGAGSANGSATRLAPARARESWPSRLIAAPTPAPSTAYWLAASNSPGLIRCAASSTPATASTTT